jgi:two-component system LytT family response regulator
MLIKLVDRLNEPFPCSESGLGDLLQISVVGVFVAAFLYLFEPFGLHGVGDDLLWLCASFGLVTIVFGTAFDLVMRYALKIKQEAASWTLWKWMLASILNLVWIAFGNYWLLSSVYPGEYSAHSFFGTMLGYTLLLGVLPVTFSGLLVQLRASSQYQQQASAIQPRVSVPQEKQQVVIQATHGESLAVDSASLLFVEAMQNYVMVHVRDDQSVTQRQIVRTTLTATEKALADLGVLRCHRSYLVNPCQIVEVEGNAQGLKLRVSGVEEFVPVSRSYIPNLRSALESSVAK